MTHERRVTISTILSLSRIVLIAPFWWALSLPESGGRWWAMLVLGVGVATDFLDGYVARHFHQVSEVGKAVDPLADKVGIAAVAIIMAERNFIPVWFVAILILRDALIVAGGLYIRRKKKIIAQSSWPGKIAVNFIALYILLSLVQWEQLETLRSIALWLSLLTMVYSLATYGQRLFIGRNAMVVK
ncbi:MAG: CDP-alcohol phosphatidyltransferase family protein [Ignavibacteriales bacterium]|nr:CDP-alcohol phosphatidyltransferase family protein [Ignavibacteriales bacterium]